MLNRKRSVFFLILALLIASASCAKKETTTTTESVAATPATVAAESTSVTTSVAPAVPAPPAVAGIATADGETPGVTATITELKRSSGETVTLKLVIANGSQVQLNTGYSFADPDNSVIDFNSIGAVQLIDPVGKKKYFVARDSEKKCVCSHGVKDIAAGTSVNVWAKFPAPPADVQKVSVILPHFSPMDDVPISGE